MSAAAMPATGSLSSCRPWAGSARPTCQLRGSRPALRGGLPWAHGRLAGWQAGLVGRGCSRDRSGWSTLGSTRVLQTGHITTAAGRQAGSRRSGSSGNRSGGSTSCSAGSNVSSEAGSVQPCPLHACLLQYGISDLAAFSTPKHLALSQEAVSRDVKPKLAALAAEGLSPKQLELVLSVKTNPLLACSYSSTFQPNLQLLQQIAAHTDHEVHPQRPKLTAVGKQVVKTTRPAAKFLSRDPGKVQQLLQSLESNMGISLQQLAACSSLCAALGVSAARVEDVSKALQLRQVSVDQLGRLFTLSPDLFGRRPSSLLARVGCLEKQLGLPAEAALSFAVRQPMLLRSAVEHRMPPLLCFLDSYMGQEGAGRRLVLEQPTLGTTTATITERSIEALELVALSQEVREIIEKHPTILLVNLSTPLQQQKLAWIGQSPWPLSVFLSNPRYLLAKTRRLAAPLALLRESGLQPPTSPAGLASYADARFMASVCKQLEEQGGGAALGQLGGVGASLA